MLFETQKKADLFIKFNSNEIGCNSKKHKKPVRSYYCDVCGGWHITSIPHWNGEKDINTTANVISSYYSDVGNKKKIKVYYNKKFGKNK